MNHNNSSSSNRRSWVWRYGLAFVAVAAGFGLRKALTAWIGPGLPTYITFYPAVMVAALLAGFGPGLLATALTALSVAFWILPPEGFAISSPVERLGVVLFTGMGLFMSVVAELYRRDRRKAAAYDQEMALRETRREKEFLADVLEHASHPFAVGYPDGRVGLCNRAYEQLTGYSAEELRTIDWATKLTPPEWRELERQKLEELQLSGQPVRYEKEYIRKDGTRVPIELLVHLVKDAGGKPEYYYSFLTDITERKRAEEATRLLSGAVEAAANGIAITDREGKILWINAAFTQLTGYTSAEAVGQNPRALKSGQHPPEFYRQMWSTILLGEVWHGELINKRKDGSLYPEEMTITPVRATGGEITHFIAVKQDITERKLAEKASQKLNEELEQRVAERTAEVRAGSLYARNLIETSLDPLVTISKDGKITDVNHATELATGVPRERLIGSNFSDYFTEPDKANAGYQKVIAEGLVRDYPLTIRHVAGHVMHVLYNAAAYHNEAGEIQGVFAAARDITERKRMEDAHSDLQRRLVKAQETERGRISRELHDRLGQDLTALKLGLQMFRKQKAFSPSVQASIGQLEKLADSLMQDIHRLAWELRPAALDDFGLDMALRRYASEWSEHNGVAVDLHSHGVETQRLPTELETTLYRITQEALTNVLRHAKAQRVGVILERRPDHVLLIVEDDGQGFDAQAVLKVADAHGKLGLLGMQERVILANGTIEIESTPGAGTTVFVRIPLESKIPAVK